jgi:hypothetical protein
MGTPVSLWLRRAVDVLVEHRETLHLDPTSLEVKQFVRQGQGERDLVRDTEALFISCGEEGVAKPLRVAEARLIAAAFRMVLPNLYRNIGESLDVALLVDATKTGHDMMTDGDGFLFFDVQQGANGAVRSLARDGLQLLLELARLSIERILRPDVLLTPFDQTFVDGELLIRHDDRRCALEWLDALLDSDGERRPLRAQTVVGDRREIGEGQENDLGRVWFTADAAVSDLRWTRHRWPGSFVDISFDAGDIARLRRTDSADYQECLEKVTAALANTEEPLTHKVVQAENAVWVTQADDPTETDAGTNSSEDSAPEGPGFLSRFFAALRGIFSRRSADAEPATPALPEGDDGLASTASSAPNEGAPAGIPLPSWVEPALASALRCRGAIEDATLRVFESGGEAALIQLVRGIRTLVRTTHARTLVDVLSDRTGTQFEKALLLAVMRSIAMPKEKRMGLFFASGDELGWGNAYVALPGGSLSVQEAAGDEGKLREVLADELAALADERKIALPKLYHLDATADAFQSGSLDIFLTLDPHEYTPLGVAQDRGPDGWLMVELPAEFFSDDEDDGDEPAPKPATAPVTPDTSNAESSESGLASESRVEASEPAPPIEVPPPAATPVDVPPPAVPSIEVPPPPRAPDLVANTETPAVSSEPAPTLAPVRGPFTLPPELRALALEAEEPILDLEPDPDAVTLPPPPKPEGTSS